MFSAAHPQPLDSAVQGDGYTRTAVLLHWGFAVVLLAELVLGWWMLDVPKWPPGLRAGWFNLHKSVGIALGVLLVWRIAWRAGHDAPALDELPRWQRRAAHAMHMLLYGCMVLLPATGYLGSAFTRYPVFFFGARLPRLLPAWPAGKELMSRLHEMFVWAFMVLLALHIAAALWHWWHRDAIASRMGLPARRSG